MRRAASTLGSALLALSACNTEKRLVRELSSFEVILRSPVGSPDHRCPLPGTPTTGVDLTGCPVYQRDASGQTVAVVNFEARALDNHGDLLDTYDNIANLRVVPGSVDASYASVRFAHGIAGADGSQFVAFRGAFADTFLWINDSQPPDRESDILGLGVPCSATSPPICADFGLTCVNSGPSIRFDPEGLAYCTKGCAADADCPHGYACASKVTAYRDAAADVSKGACLRTQPTYATGAAGPIYLTKPTIADVRRSTSLVQTAFEKEFVAIERGRMVVTTIDSAGFFATDVCPLLGKQGKTGSGCTPENLAQPEGFDSVYVYNYSTPEDLLVGDRLNTIAGPVSSFNGFVEINFPYWEVDAASQDPQTLARRVPPPVDLHDKIADHFPGLVEPGGLCYDTIANLAELRLFECGHALNELESARVSIVLQDVLPIMPGSQEEKNFLKYGQWQFDVDVDSTPGHSPVGVFAAYTQDNINGFDPRTLVGLTINKRIAGNLRKVAFDEDETKAIWIIEPRDPGDCTWCMNPKK